MNTWITHDRTMTSEVYMIDGYAVVVTNDSDGPWAAADVVYFDGLQAELGTESGEYFDGDTLDTLEYAFNWSGTPHNSESTMDWIGPTLFTATPDPANGNILLDITPGTSSTVDAITRTDANGTHPVRLLPNQLPTPSQLIVRDYEAALTGPVTYTLTGAGGSQVTTSLGSDHPWLFVPVYPQFSAAVESVTGYTSDRATQTTVHQVIGRPDPLVTIGRLQTRAGTLEIWCASHADALTVQNVYSLGHAVMLRQVEHAGLDMYHFARAVTVDPFAPQGARTRWRVAVDYVEVNRPTADLAGSLGWNYSELAAAHTSYFEVAFTYADYNALLVGPLT
ncbi:hypothetical protein EXU48_15705 [Occultella glacieicola]|uniref:Uncharacterized protein n=1 Tax=Occultella glacieicola TaxID=2518684 RepID=A0ABY2E1C6_9MICO|nr:hypothetical protein [Occultella glacieicola]TDE91589.1 hypothetical protein EXU48_15705 [Occultella glacieicola]